MNNVEWEKCPRCESVAVVTRGKFYYMWLICATGFFMSLIGILFPLIWLISIPMIIVCPVGLFLPATKFCNSCKYAWKPSPRKMNM